VGVVIVNIAHKRENLFTTQRCPLHSSTGSEAREHDQRYTLDKADGNKYQWFPNELGMGTTYIHMGPFQIHKAIE
jgi:hypothetical protein